MFLAALLLATATTISAQEIGAESRTIVVHVTDAKSGDPVPGAFVSVVGPGAGPSAISGADGRARLDFAPAPGQSLYKLYTHPSGFAPSMTTVHAGGGYGLGELLVVPEGEFTTGLVTASRGGVFTWETMLQGFVGTSPASFKLTIPAGALGEDFEVLVAPRPSWTNIRTGQPYASLGQVHLQVRNAAGVKVNPVFRKPIQIEHSLWGFPALETYDPMQAPPEADAWRYNDNAHAFEVHPSTAVVVDLQAGVVRYSLTQFSLWEIIQKESRNYVYSHGQWGVTVQSPSPDPPSITNTSVCGEEVRVPVYCGRYTASGEIDVDKESGITISAGLKTALQASYGAQTTLVLASISAQIGVSFEVNLSGEFSSKMSRGMKGSVVSGDNAWNACGSGTAKLVVVERLHTISLGRVVLGTVRRPMGISTVLNLSWDTSCSGCEPGGQGKQDQLPCTPPG